MEINPRFVRIGAVARELGLSVGRVRQLADAGDIPFVVSPGGHRYFDLDVVRGVRGAHRPDPTTIELLRTVPLQGADEDVVWRWVRDAVEFDDARRSTLGYCFTEMLNNAIDHSAGAEAVITIGHLDDILVVRIEDDGCGVFSHLMADRGLPDLTAAVAELTKGKVTTAPERHTGEGIFFTSKAVDEFRLESDGLRWTVDNRRGDHAVGRSDVVRGTRVTLELDAGSRVDLADVFREFTTDTVFDRTRPVIRLFALGVEFVSRSEAKRLAVGLDRFREVELDFAGVEAVGQGFVDELFRVWAREHPGTRLVPTNATASVAFMIDRGLPGGGRPSR